jgi:hypothetical protein
VHDVLEPAGEGDRASHVFDICLVSLIALNVLAVILETVEPIGQRYAPLFRWFEYFSVSVFAIEYDAGSYSQRQIRRKAHAFKPYAGQIWGAPSHARVRHLGYLLQKVDRRSVALYAPWD